MIKYIKAIKAINPNAEFTFNDVDNITWLNGTTPISKSDIEQKINEREYIDKRAAEYPSIVDELLAVWVEIRFSDPPPTPLGRLVIADMELLLHTLIDMCYSFGYLSFTAFIVVFQPSIPLW